VNASTNVLVNKETNLAQQSARYKYTILYWRKLYIP